MVKLRMENNSTKWMENDTNSRMKQARNFINSANCIFTLQLYRTEAIVVVYSHPYISFFHLLLNVFFVTCFRTFFC